MFIIILQFFVLSLSALDLSHIASESLLHSSSYKNEKPSWTPDESSIVFGTNRDGNYEIYIMDVDGSNQRNLTNSQHNEMFPSVSPEGKKIAYVGEVEGNYDIYVMNIDGSHKIRLTNHEKTDDWPSWAEKGKKIVFDSDRSGSWGIYIMNNDGTSKEILVDTEEKDVDPAASPFSSKVILSRQVGEVRYLFSFDINSKEEKRLTFNEMTNAHPSLNFESNKIVFNAGVDFWDIYTMNIDGSDIKQLTRGEHDDKWGVWSPDGSKIAFNSNRNGNWDIYTMNSDGSGIKRLTFGSSKTDGK